MALRLVNKINRQFIKNVSRSMSTSRDVLDIEPKQEDANTRANDSLKPIQQYQVCRPRTTPVTRFYREAQNEADAARQYVALQHLQPALLPEYYTPPLEIHSSICPDPLTEVDKQSNQIRRLEESKTCLNVSLPLRGPKLASPFPSPVKMMESHTVSDQEKAEQMLAEAKVHKGVSADKTRHQQAMKTIPSFRLYSTNQDGQKSGESEKPCPKLDGKKTTKSRAVKHFQMPRCETPKTISCKKDKVRAECKKKEAPYPSYSESCHEEPLEKPSECKMCPWKTEEHPTFKPPHKHFHSASGVLFSKKGQCQQEPTGTFQKTVSTNEEQKKKDKQKKKKPKKKSAPPLIVPVELQCIYKPDKNFEIPELEMQRKKDDVQSVKTKSKPNTTRLNDDIALWLDNLRPIATSSEPNVSAEDSLDMFSSTSGADKKKQPCQKFPFKSEDFPFEKKRAPAASKTQGKCPKKKSRRMIVDCPKEEDETGGKKKCVKQVKHGVLAAKKKDRDEAKCPKVELGVCKDKSTKEDDDPCNTKRQGKTWKCPTDLLKKKKRNPRKKSSAVETSIPLSSQVKTTNSATSL